MLSIGGGQAINQVDANVFKTSLFCPIKALAGVFGVVLAAQILQIVVEKTLDADAEAINAQVAQVFKVFQRQRVGVGFEGDFRLVCNGIGRINKVEQIANFVRAEQGRGAAAEIDGIYGFGGCVGNATDGTWG